ncbi:hypothetical protein [uncultured Methanobrevibacter sp.]|uniref:hypothetical protein n=1 Tax=uncultured Methanobrevibacter sp. TaxID=253161 RepID=UPI0025D95547|nr:hypothetical protein [uncultured Methanobrevibacter sp.]
MNLTQIYNALSNHRQNMGTIYKLIENLSKSLPLDVDYHNAMNSTVLDRIIWGNMIGMHLAAMFPTGSDYFEIQNAIRKNCEKTINVPEGINQIEKEMLEVKRMRVNIATQMNVYNQVLKGVTKFNLSYADLLVIEGFNKFNFTELHNPAVLDILKKEVLSRQDVIGMEQLKNHTKEYAFSQIDVASLRDKLNRFKEVCPVGYWVLMDYINDLYNFTMLSNTLWKYNYKSQEFCFVGKNGDLVSYYDLYKNVSEMIIPIMESLGVFDKDGNVIYKSVNYKFGHLVYDNPYSNIFNKKNYYHSIEVNEHNFELIFNDLDNDLTYLKNISNDLYQNLTLFSENKSVSEWRKSLDFSVEGVLKIVKAYDEIFDQLDNYRNSSMVLENEVNVIIDQLNLDMAKNLKADQLKEVRSYLLYFIYFWEFNHHIVKEAYLQTKDLINRGSKMSFNLLNASIDDNFARYNEILNHVVYSVFDNDNFDSLSLEDMKKTFINDLYRSYHSYDKYVDVFETIKLKELINFENFRYWENHINSIDKKDRLINLYKAIQNRLYPNRDVLAPGSSNKDSLSSKELNDIINLIHEEDIPDNDNIYNGNSQDVMYFMGAWNAFAQKYPNVSQNVLNNLMGGDMNKFFLRKDLDFHYVRSAIIVYIKDNYQIDDKVNGNIHNNINNDNNPIPKGSGLSHGQFDEIKNIWQNHSIYPKKDYNVISDSMIRLHGSWESFETKYPDIADKVKKNLFNSGSLYDYARKYSSANDFNEVRQSIINFVHDNYYDTSFVLDVKQVPDDSLVINGTKVSECDISTLYIYAVEQVMSSNLGPDEIETLRGELNLTMLAYKQFWELMNIAGMDEIHYINKVDQFKNSILDILNVVGVKNPTFNDINGIIEDNTLSKDEENPTFKVIKGIMENKTLSMDEDIIITDSNSEYEAFLASWNKFAKEYPDIAKNVLEILFKNSERVMKDQFIEIGGDALRKKIIDFVKYILNSGQDQIPIPNQDSDKFVILAKSTNDTSIADIKGFMAEAVNTAKGFVNQINTKDNALATKLNSDIDKLYKEYLNHVESSNHEWQYKKFISALQKLFEDNKKDIFDVTVKNEISNVTDISSDKQIDVLDIVRSEIYDGNGIDEEKICNLINKDNYEVISDEMLAEIADLIPRSYIPKNKIAVEYREKFQKDLDNKFADCSVKMKYIIRAYNLLLMKFMVFDVIIIDDIYKNVKSQKLNKEEVETYLKNRLANLNKNVIICSDRLFAAKKMCEENKVVNHKKLYMNYKNQIYDKLSQLSAYSKKINSKNAVYGNIGEFIISLNELLNKIKLLCDKFDNDKSNIFKIREAIDENDDEDEDETFNQLINSKVLNFEKYDMNFNAAGFEDIKKIIYEDKDEFVIKDSEGKEIVEKMEDHSILGAPAINSKYLIVSFKVICSNYPYVKTKLLRHNSFLNIEAPEFYFTYNVNWDMTLQDGALNKSRERVFNATQCILAEEYMNALDYYEQKIKKMRKHYLSHYNSWIRD